MLVCLLGITCRHTDTHGHTGKDESCGERKWKDGAWDVSLLPVLWNVLQSMLGTAARGHMEYFSVPKGKRAPVNHIKNPMIIN